MAEIPHTARTLVDDCTAEQIDAEAEARGVDRAVVIRDVLHAWAHQRDEVQKLIERRRKSQGQERAEEGTKGQEP